MSPAEIAELLVFAGGYGVPRPDQAGHDAWHHALHQIDLDDAIAAIVDHYRESTADVMPADIWSRCRVPEAPKPPEQPQRRPDPKRWHRMWTQALALGAHENEARRALVLGCKPPEGSKEPPLAMRLCDEPLNFSHPSQWTGYIPPEHFNGGRNSSPRRAALLAIVTEAEERLAARMAGGGDR